MELNLSLIDVRNLIGNNYYSRGLDYNSCGLVKKVSFSDNKIYGIVIKLRKDGSHLDNYQYYNPSNITKLLIMGV